LPSAASLASARTTGLAGAWLERDEAILVNLRKADEYAREYVVVRVRSSLRAAAPAACRQEARFPAQQRQIATQSHGRRFDNLLG
jgi:hypothetical protein